MPNPLPRIHRSSLRLMPGRSTFIGAADGAATHIGPHQIRPWAQQVEAKVPRPISPWTHRRQTGHRRPGPRDSRQERQFPARSSRNLRLRAPALHEQTDPACGRVDSDWLSHVLARAQLAWHAAHSNRLPRTVLVAVGLGRANLRPTSRLTVCPKCSLLADMPMIVRRGPVQRPGVRRAGQSARGHVHCRHGCDADRNRR
jgi:hypothetical protein